MGTKRAALLVGIDAYPSNVLRGCVADAKELAACLTLDNYDYDVRLLLDGQATRSTILRSLNELMAPRESASETLLIYFAGHGLLRGDSGYLVTVDGEPFDPGISLAELSHLVETAASRYQRIITILDCCHAGAAFTWPNVRPLTNSAVEREVFVVNETRSIMAACTSYQSAAESGGTDPHGEFTAALLDGLLGDAVNYDGQVTLLGLFEFVSRQLTRPDQTPVLKGDVTGTVVLGDGFSPRMGAPIDDSEKRGLLSKAQTLVDQHRAMQFRELRDRDYRATTGARICSADLEQVLRWFSDTETAFPDLRRDHVWSGLRSSLRDFQSALADIRVGDDLRGGRVSSRIGAGGFGQVWRLVDSDGRSNALKVFHGSDLADDIKVARFRNGFSNMRKLDHPRIVKVAELSLAPLGFVMEYIEGPDLRDAHLDRSDPATLLRLLIEIAETIASAHAQSVRHRDIKPENIVLDYLDDGSLRPHLTDFDLAYHETNRTITNVSVGVGGVINYAAPEQLYEPNAAKARLPTVDVFGFAQLLFFVLTGRDPSPELYERNVEQLGSVVGAWIDDRAATEVVKLYRESSLREPGERPQNMGAVTARLLECLAVIEEASGQDGGIRSIDLARRVAHAYAGLGNFECEGRSATFTSLSEAVHIEIEVLDEMSKVCDVRINAILPDRLTIPNVKSNEAARQSVNSRLDRALSKFNAQRHAGRSGGYSASIDVPKVPLTLDGVNTLVQIVHVAVGSIENW